MTTQPIAVITGSSGAVGQACAKIFRENGWFVIGADMESESSEITTDAFYKIDLSKDSEIKYLSDDVTATYGRLNTLVNCAGVAPKDVTQISMDLMPDEEFDRIISINLRAPWLLCKLFRELLANTPASSIVNVSSVFAYKTLATSGSSYTPNKDGLCALTKSLALEFKPSNIRVNSVLPAILAAPIPINYIRNDLFDAVDISRNGTNDFNRNCLDVEVAHVAETIFFLADSSRSSKLSGVDILVDSETSLESLRKLTL